MKFLNLLLRSIVLIAGFFLCYPLFFIAPELPLHFLGKIQDLRKEVDKLE